MRKFKGTLFIGLLVGVLLSISLSALAVKAPFDRWITKLTGDMTINQNGVTSFTAGSLAEADLEAYDSDGLLVKRVARATFDYAVDIAGGTAGTYDLGIDLPASSLLEESVIYIETQFVDDTSATVEINCGDGGNILAATDITGNADGTVIQGAPKASGPSGRTVISSSCDVQAYVTGTNSAGKLILFLEYYEVD